MAPLRPLLAALALLTQSALALSPKYLPCQIIAPGWVSPTLGCPPGTLYVSQNDTRADFTRIQAAIDSLCVHPRALHRLSLLTAYRRPAGRPAHILIGAGEYHESVNITRAAPLTLLGELPARALLDVAQPAPPPRVRIWDAKYIGQRPGMDDADTATLVVAPNYAAALIGAGPPGAPLQPAFGNADFKAYNLAFENRAAAYAIAQALATDVSYANASFYGCAFASFQDTWYTGRNASTYVVDSTVYGQTDYLFGFGTAWFERSTLASRACGGGVVAWKGTNQTDAPGNRYGAYVSDSRIIRSPDANVTTNITGACYLGRPWNDLATTVFLRTYMDAIVRPAGFTPFSTSRPTIMNTTFYAEFDSYGMSMSSSRLVSCLTLDCRARRE
jgi:pectin methylesterase-like acyl-CoA thioesterase